MCAQLIRKENETKLKISRGTNFSFIPTPSWATYCKTSARTREKEWTILGHDSVSLESFLIASWGFYEQGAGLLKSCNVCLLGTTASSFDTLASSSLSSSIRDIINVNIMATTIKMTTATRQMKTLEMISIRRSLPRLGLFKVASLTLSIVHFCQLVSTATTNNIRLVQGYQVYTIY